MINIELNNKAQRRLLQGHPWIFRSDIRLQGQPEAGIARLQSTQGKFLGQALYSPHSEIALRFLSSREEAIDVEFWRKRLLQARALREERGIPSDAYRVVFGESDGIPSFVLDQYGEAFSFQMLSAGLESQRKGLLQAVRELFSPRLLVERNDVSVRNLEQLPQSAQILEGEGPSTLLVWEGDLKFEVDLLEGQKTGAFLDQRTNRFKAAEYARGRMKLLDVCSYQGWFSCHMARGAGEVTAIDQSGQACRSVARNAEINGLKNIRILEQNAFDCLKELDQGKAKFDLINLDPPAFVKSRKQLQNALRGYKELNLRALRMLKEGGILITSSCSHHLSESNFVELLQEAAMDARRKVQILERGMQGPDHPVLLGFPESNYLKCFFLRVL